jgi:hypothetical protein
MQAIASLDNMQAIASLGSVPQRVSMPEVA